MQASQENTITGGSRLFFNQPLRDKESYCWSCIQNVPHYQCSADVSIQGLHLSADTFEQHCTLESSSGTGGSCAARSSQSTTTSFSPNESGISQQNSQSYPSDVHDSPDQTSGSQTSESYVTHKLRELETAMLGPDLDVPNSFNNDIMRAGDNNQTSTETDKWKFLGDVISRGDLREGLCGTCSTCQHGASLIHAPALRDMPILQVWVHVSKWSDSRGNQGGKANPHH
ncbi:unnamed protein product [Linum tenue]|uniref:Uncharacterized protein n=1 Tax=Linum tenue TaxID=586396 RepID=A0AAV0LT97_9ROSI|nr:unnamed protein product [Linum tenue]